MITPSESRELYKIIEGTSEISGLCNFIKGLSYEEKKFTIRTLIQINIKLLDQLIVECDNPKGILAIFGELNFHNDNILNSLSVSYRNGNLVDEINQFLMKLDESVEQKFSILVKSEVLLENKYVELLDYTVLKRTLQNYVKNYDSLLLLFNSKTGNEYFLSLSEDERKELNSILVIKLLEKEPDYQKLIDLILIMPNGVELYYKIIRIHVDNDLISLNIDYTEDEELDNDQSKKLTKVIKKWKYHTKILMKLNTKESQILLGLIFESNIKSYTFNEWKNYISNNIIGKDLTICILNSLYNSHKFITKLKNKVDEKGKKIYKWSYIKEIYKHQVSYYLEHIGKFTFAGYRDEIIEMINYTPRIISQNTINKLLTYLENSEDFLNYLDNINTNHLTKSSKDTIIKIGQNLRDQIETASIVKKKQSSLSDYF